MSEYINSDYINIEFVVPTRENVYGHILINAKTNKSIIKLTCRAPSKKGDKSFKAYKVETDQDLIPTSTLNEFFYSNSSRASVKKAKMLGCPADNSLISIGPTYPNKTNDSSPVSLS